MKKYIPSRIEKKVYNKVAKLAKQDKRTQQDEIEVLLTEAIEKRKGK